jgi:HSP20 family molecular chaperone IbpA
MESVYVKVPITKTNTTFPGEEIEGNPLFQTLESLVYPVHPNMTYKSKKCRGNNTTTTTGRCFNPMEQEQQSEFDIVNFLTNQLNTKPWFTVIPLGVFRPEEVTVKLNPLCHVLIIKATPLTQRTTFTKPIHRVINLPKTVRIEKMQVKLTQRGELVVIAPFKLSKTRQTQQTFDLEEEQDTFPTISPFFCQETGLKNTKLPWTTIPVVDCSTKKFFYPCQEELDMESEDSDVTTDSDSDSETETDEMESEMDCCEDIFQQRETGVSSTFKSQVQNYVRLLQKIFYPNIIEAKIVRDETTTTTLQLLVDIKFVDFLAEEVNVCIHDVQPNVLIVEAKKVRQFEQFPHCGKVFKYVRREFDLPVWINLNKLMYRVLSNGVLRIKMPFLPTIGGTTRFINPTGMTGTTLSKTPIFSREAHPCMCNLVIVKRTQEEKKFQKPIRRPCNC